MDNPAAPKRRIIDISTPGSMPPGPSSRPVIVGHKPSVADPMVSSREHTPPVHPGDLAQNTAYPNRHNKSIEPHPVTADKPAEQSEVPSISESSPTDATSPPPPPPKPPMPKPADNPPQAQPEEAPAPATPPEAPAPKTPKDPEANQTPEKIQQMVSDKTYFAPIASTKSWTWIMIAAVVLSLIGIAGAIYLVMA